MVECVGGVREYSLLLCVGELQLTQVYVIVLLTVSRTGTPDVGSGGRSLDLDNLVLLDTGGHCWTLLGPGG